MAYSPRLLGQPAKPSQIGEKLAKTWDILSPYVTGPVDAWKGLMEADLNTLLYDRGAGGRKAVEDAFNVAGTVTGGGTFAKRPVNSVGMGGRVDATVAERGEKILALLKSGEAKNITDDMLDMGNPALTAQLNDYLFQNYDLPMDASARAQRATEAGFTSPTYHGGFSDIERMSDWHGTSEGGAKALFSSDEARAANTYAPSKPNAVGQNVTPLSLKAGDYFEAGYKAPFPDNANDKEIDAWLDGLERYNRRLDPDGAKDRYFTRNIETAQNQKKSGVVFRQTEDDRVPSVYTMPSDVYVSLDPTTVRSRFARFDPRLGHLRNLNAGVSGLGVLLGYGLLGEEDPLK